MLEKLCNALLDDDHGISNDAYWSLIKYLESIDRQDLIDRISEYVKETEGRRYVLQPFHLNTKGKE